MGPRRPLTSKTLRAKIFGAELFRDKKDAESSFYKEKASAKVTGSKISNMEESAAASGISRPTLSKYFNDPESVRVSTRFKIERALETNDYPPNIYAINQNRRLTKDVGIVVPYLSDPFFAEIARNVETLAIKTGYRPSLLSSQGNRTQEVENLDGLRSIKPAGVLLAPLGRTSDALAVEKNLRRCSYSSV